MNKRFEEDAVIINRAPSHNNLGKNEKSNLEFEILNYNEEESKNAKLHY
eukprot:CAMPEP_0202979086 /NCGR_PEP_ID=MMETSP1396-20130829/85332_1 /ASSEMBLY_ACC=CAM_ASM_000872 /TAXON_ID= /ORGANISM="Pseudokeronopsis sp., Strain Brazil" /LENGTH=48 /DNA_ID=CAMNT_0049718351 /DNA_START=306 /DNA_END=455 /DNA_ORIENTATION=-